MFTGVGTQYGRQTSRDRKSQGCGVQRNGWKKKSVAVGYFLNFVHQKALLSVITKQWCSVRQGEHDAQIWFSKGLFKE